MEIQNLIYISEKKTLKQNIILKFKTVQFENYWKCVIILLFLIILNLIVLQ